MYCEVCFRLCGNDVCASCWRDPNQGTERCVTCGCACTDDFVDARGRTQCEGCFSVETFTDRAARIAAGPRRIRPRTWAAPMLVSGLTLRIETVDGAVEGGAVLEPSRTVPLAAVEVFMLTAAAGGGWIDPGLGVAS